MFIITIVGAISWILLSLSPLPSIIRASKLKDTDEVAKVFLVLFNTSSLIWAIFGIRTDSEPLIYAATASFCLTIALIIWIQFIQRTLLYFSLKYIISTALIGVLRFDFFDEVSIGTIGVISTFAAYLGLLDQLQYSIIERESRFIDLFVVLSTLSHCVCWIVIGGLIDNFYVVVPSTIGCLISVIQLLAFLWAKDIFSSSLFSGAQAMVRGINSLTQQSK